MAAKILLVAASFLAASLAIPQPRGEDGKGRWPSKLGGGGDGGGDGDGPVWYKEVWDEPRPARIPSEGNGEGGDPIPAYIMMVEDRAEVIPCRGEVNLNSGSEYEIKNTYWDCKYTLEMAAGVSATITCSSFDVDCSDGEKVWINVRAGYSSSWKSYCGYFPTEFKVYSSSSAQTLTFEYESGFSIGGDMSCIIKGDGGSSSPSTPPTSPPPSVPPPPPPPPTSPPPTSPPPSSPSNSNCGKSSSAAGRIINGGYASDGEYPWLAWMTGTDGSKAWSCGASIINDQWMLTAAHCVPDPKGWGSPSVTFCFGANYRRSCAKEVTSTKVYPHHSYDFAKEVQPHDIALVKLPEKLSFTSTISPVCLPTQSAPVGSDFEIAGWGKVDTQNGSDFLKKANMKVMARSTCPVDSNYKIVCLYEDGGAYPKGRSCQGDSGGYGGIRSSDGTATIYGVTSFGYNDRATGLCLQPSAYTDVYQYLSWMDTIMQYN